MHKFILPVVTGVNRQGLPCFGVMSSYGFVANPFQDELGYKVDDPVKAYGIGETDAHALVQLNTLLEGAVEDALNAGCLHIQDGLDISSGDVAGLHFSGLPSRVALTQVFLQYMQTERNFSND